MNTFKSSFHNLIKKNHYFVFVVILFLCIVSVRANTTKRSVKVGVFDLNGFYYTDDFGHLTGYGIDYMNQIAQYTGWNIEYIQYETWVEALDNFDKGNIDLLAPSQMTPERLQKYSFCTYSMGTEYGSLLTLNTNKNLIYEDYETFSKIKIGCVPSLVFLPNYREYEKDHNFLSDLYYYKDTQTLIAALNAGEVDAIVVNLMVKTPTMKVLAQFGPAAFYTMVHKNDYKLKIELDNAIKKIKSTNISFENQLIEKYFSHFAITPLSKKEIDYIQNMDSFNIGYVPEFAPISYTKDGIPSGITVEVVNQISELSGLKFNFIELPSINVSYSYLRNNKIDIVTNVENSTSNANLAGLKLTDSYFKTRKVFVMKNDRDFSMSKNYLLALTTPSRTTEQIINKEFPNITLKYFNTTKECFEALKKNTVDLLLENQYIVEPFLSKPKYKEMHILPVIGINNELSMAIIVNQRGINLESERLASPLLLSILNKSIEHIKSNDISNIIIKEITQNQYKYTFGDFIYLYRLWIILLSFILLILFLILLQIRRMRHKNIALVAASEQKLRHITNNINGGVVVLEPNKGLRITYANNGFLELIGLTRQEYEEKKNFGYTAFVHPDDIEKLNQLVENSRKVNKEQKISTELRLKRLNGTYIQALFNGTLANEDNNKQVLYCVIIDISLQVKLTEELQFSQKRYETLMDQTGDIIYEINIKTGHIITSHQFKDKFGWTLPDEINIKSNSSLIDIWNIAPDDISKLIKSIEKVTTKGEANTCEIKLLTNEKSICWCELFQFPMTNKKGEIISVVGRITDINEKIIEREALLEKSRRDALTNVYTKTAFHELASLYLLQEPSKCSAIIFTDLDHFKQINDTLGHLIGDQAIIDASIKLQTIFSNIDIISRFGGDEFCILVKDISPEILLEKLNWMLEKMKSTYTDEENNEVTITCSIGVAFTTECGTDIDVLTECADKALYKAKENGRNQYKIYNSLM